MSVVKGAQAMHNDIGQIGLVGLIGYGEVGKIFCAGLKAIPGIESVSAWDLKFADAALHKKELAMRGILALRVLSRVPPCKPCAPRRTG